MLELFFFLLSGVQFKKKKEKKKQLVNVSARLSVC